MSDSDPQNPTVEHHLFIIWSAAAEHRQAILDDMSRRFDAILSVHRIQWRRGQFLANLRRFYGEPLPIMLNKVRHCGRGRFDVVIVRDRSPRYDHRNTTKGVRLVNVNSFDAKSTYRKMSGGGHRIHATNDAEELARDLVLLLGQAAEQLHRAPAWNGREISICRHLTGFGGWRSLAELFFVLNHAVPYVVLRHDENLPDSHGIDGHLDIDLLTDDRRRFLRLANAAPGQRPGRPALAYVRVSGNLIPLDVRSIGDGYYDPRMAADLLARRQLNTRDIYVPAPSDAYLAHLYHAAVHKRAISPDVAQHLAALARRCGLQPPGSFDDPAQVRDALDALMTPANYAFTEPRDPSVHFNPAITGRPASRFSRRIVVPLYRALLRRRD